MKRHRLHPARRQHYQGYRSALARILTVLTRLPLRSQIAKIHPHDTAAHINAFTLADELGVSQKTILRDIQFLRELGFQIEYSTHHNCFYLIDPGQPLLDLTRLRNSPMVITRSNSII